MVKITKVTPVRAFYVDTDASDWPYWRTDSNGTSWENLMGMSWEELDPPEEVKDAFNKWLKDWYWETYSATSF